MHILLCVVLGIYIQHTYTILSSNYLSLSLGITILIIIFIIVFNTLKKVIFFKSCLIILFIILGITCEFVSNNMNSKKFYMNFYSLKSTIIIDINEELKQNKYHKRFIAEVNQIDQNNSCGKLIFNVDNSIRTDSIFFNRLIIPNPKLNLISKAKNPHDFDYAEFMKKKGIIHQLYLNDKNFIIDKNYSISFSKFALTIRNTLQKKLKQYSFTKDQLSVINALLLGQRQEISSELKESYTKAGAIHILAISGLHIGIIYYLLNFLFKPLLYFKNGNKTRALIIITFLWFFAFVTGLSPSVVRATTMFTFIIIGKLINRNQPIEFSLISSMLLILLVKPMFLFDLGFQLSYLAVFGIVWIQPILFKFWTPKSFLFNKFWELSTVSIAAQLSTLPISLYYFHQFPGLFLLANLLIIPFISFILILGFIVLALAFLNILPEFLVTFYGKTIDTINFVIHKIASQEEFIITKINMPFSNMIICYILILFTILLFEKFKLKTLFKALFTILILQSFYIYQKQDIKSKKEFIVFHKNKNSVIGIRNQNTLKLTNYKGSEFSNTTFLKNYITKENINKIDSLAKDDVLKFSDHFIISIDSMAVYPNKKLKNSIIILKHSPKLNMARLLKIVQPKLVIADGSNYKSYIKQWKNICKKEKTPFHCTYENGAYILKE
ncbi:ComEC/Rec2 family competence protein [Tenacibaculum sp. ZS6-P6]|uniref:ComEC/Rec2 family competence protein n=1 Tax=Tenacibaculum sp. ZS6-P6 TaxID=3447503 RepID=UPI003F949F0D